MSAACRRVSTSPASTAMIGFDREQRPDRRLRAADPAALLEVLERVERDVHPEVRRPVVEDAGDLLGRDTQLRHLEAQVGRGSPRPSTRPASRRGGSPGRGAGPSPTSALFIAPDSCGETWTETIASAPVGEGAVVDRLELARARRRPSSGTAHRARSSAPRTRPSRGRSPARNDSSPNVTDSGDDRDAVRLGLGRIQVRGGIGHERDTGHSFPPPDPRHSLPRDDTGPSPLPRVR